MTEYHWDSIFELLAYENLQHYISISQLKQSVEEDDPITLGTILGNHTSASIYALIHCFVKPPPLRCIRYLVAKGTPLDQTFPHNPFQRTAMDILLSRFRWNDETYLIIKRTIDAAKKEYRASLLKAT